MATAYEREWQRQLARQDVPDDHLGVHRWYLRMERQAEIGQPAAPTGVTIARAVKPSVAFYRFLYHTAGEDFLWADRRRMRDSDLAAKIERDDCHVTVVYCDGCPAGFFELSFKAEHENELKYFALLPGFLGRGFGRFMLEAAIATAFEVRALPLIVDTCSLDHGSALLNYQKRGFEIYREKDEIYLDPRLDGTIPTDAAGHVPYPANRR